MWLTRNAQRVFSKVSAQSSVPTDHHGAACSSAQAVAGATKATPNLLLNTAYLEILEWDDNNVYPEASMHMYLFVKIKLNH